jgi:D-alanine-D-alanine ligase
VIASRQGSDGVAKQRSESRRLSVAVVQGGPSTEAQVSRSSAAGVAAALIEAGHMVVRLELDAFLAESLRTGGYDVVFPAVHGAVGEDGSIQGMLELLDLPYVGSGVLASALAIHKRVARVVFESAGLPVARGISLGQRACGGDARAAADRARAEVGAALVVKPSSHGSAIGVTRLEGDAPIDDVVRAIEGVWTIDDFAIAEEFARGCEVTCGVLDVEGALALPPTEILSPKDPFYNYAARYTKGRSVHVCPAQLSQEHVLRVQQLALAAHAVLGCRDLSRVDFVVDPEAKLPKAEQATASVRSSKGDRPHTAITLLEVNTLPGMTPTSLYPEAASVHGISMPRLCDALVKHAHARGGTRRHDSLPLPAR